MESGIFAAGLMSLAIGGTMSVIGWNVIRQNCRREAARTALLSQLAFPGGGSGQAVSHPSVDAAGLSRLDEFPRESSAEAEPLFTTPAPLGADWRRRAVLAATSVAGAFAIGALFGLATIETTPAAAPSTAPAVDAGVRATTESVPSPTQGPGPVELVALTYRVTPTAFLVTGQVRNPAGGTPLNQVAAVVEVMDEAGRVLMTVRAPLTRESSNGEAWTFSATASKATNVARYRVEFQTGEHVVIPHVDRRRA